MKKVVFIIEIVFSALWCTIWALPVFLIYFLIKISEDKQVK